MKLKNLTLGLAISTFFFACDDEEDKDKDKEGSANINCETFVTTDYLELLQDVTDAQTAYAADPSSANCLTYYNSLNTYVDSWKGFVSKCYPQLEDTYKSYWEIWDTTFAQLDESCGS